MLTLNQIQKRLDKSKGAKPQELKFEKVPRGEVTAAQAKEVVERMKRAYSGGNPLGKIKVPFWKRPFKRIKI